MVSRWVLELGHTQCVSDKDNKIYQVKVGYSWKHTEQNVFIEFPNLSAASLQHPGFVFISSPIVASM